VFAGSSPAVSTTLLRINICLTYIGQTVNILLTGNLRKIQIDKCMELFLWVLFSSVDSTF